MNLNSKNFTIKSILTNKKSKNQTIITLSSVIIVFFAVIAIYIVIYQIRNTPSVNKEDTPPISNNKIPDEQMESIAKALTRDSMNKPTPTTKELDTIVRALNKDAKGQKRLTTEELQNIANKLNQK